jgi:hypothetical protein
MTFQQIAYPMDMRRANGNDRLTDRNLRPMTIDAKGLKDLGREENSQREGINEIEIIKKTTPDGTSKSVALIWRPSSHHQARVSS